MEAIVIGAATNIVSDARRGIFQEVQRHVRYVINHKKNVEKFEEKMKLLIAKRKSVQQEVDAEERNLWKIKADVELWCKLVDKAIDEEVKKVKDLEDKAKAKCFIGLCPNIKSRYLLSRKAEEDVAAVDELLQQCQFNKVAFRDVPEAPITAAPKNFKAFDSRKKVFNEIMEALKDSTTSMIGVYGVGGVGKTTLVNEVARQAEEVKLFGLVVKATVTRTPKIEEIQDQIAESLCFKLEQKSIRVRAHWLSERLKKENKILIVLDDIWAGLNLEEVGIPFGDQHNGCKMLLTSRNRNVLTNEMDANKTIHMGILIEEEAWDLFKKMVGYDFENRKLQSVATEVAKRCAGLPLAIVTVARALRNKDLYAWEDASQQLQMPSPSNFTGIPAAVYSAIELSYDSLGSNELKQTFLLSCLLGNNAHIQDLLRYAMGLHLFDGLNTVEKNRNRILTLVSNLKDSCLLLDGYKDDCIAMHDFVCDVALAIASRDNLAFALKHGDVFEDWADEQRMKELKWISLSFASINKLPHKLECPQLSLFSMGTSSMDSYVEMPIFFFENIENILVLDLIKMDYSSSPSSISLPTSLRTLCLKQCMLGDMVNLGKLKNLEILSLSGSDIEILPEEIGQLTNLKLLDLSSCTKLRIIPPNVLSSLTRLEELYMSYVFVPWHEPSNARLDELKDLSCLTTLDICIVDANLVPKDLFSEKLQRYKILIGGEWGWLDKVEYSRTLKLRVNTSIDHLDHGVKRLLKKAEALSLENLEGVKIVLNQVGNRDCILHLNHLHVRNASEIQYIMNDNEAIDRIAFRGLRSLTLENLPHLISFCSSKHRTMGSTSIPQHDLPLFGEEMELPCLEDLCLSSINVGKIWHNQFSTLENLTSLDIQGCGNLKYIFSSSLARSLVHLKSLEIVECKSLREIIFAGDIKEENEVTIFFPQLRTIKMKNLPLLLGYCSENYNFAFPLLWKLEIEQCPEFKSFNYKSTTEENQLHSERAVFNEKVVCPRLAWLIVKGCHNLKCVFSFSMMPLLPELQYITVEDCANVEVIFIEEEGAVEEDIIFPKLRFLFLQDLPKLMRFCHGSYLEFPMLRVLNILNCPTFKGFISASKNAQGNSSDIYFPPLFTDKLAFPQLETLGIANMGNFRKIWQGRFVGDSFSKLVELWVCSCKKLVNVFPFNMHERLQNLQRFDLADCDSLDEIFEPQVLNADELHAVTATQSIVVEEATTNFVFPKLTYLQFYKLPRLKSFYSKMHTTEWPSLNKMWVYGCDMVEIFASESLIFGELTNQQPLFLVNEGAFPNLEELKLEWNDIMRKIWHGQLRADVFSKLRVLELIIFPDTSAVFPHCFIQSLPNLEKLVVSDAAFSQIFNLEGFDGNEMNALALTSLNEFRLAKLPQLTHIWKEEYNLSRAFSKLRSLEVIECRELKTLVPSSVSFANLTNLEVSRCHGFVNLIAYSTAESLVQLTRMSITDCDMIEGIIAGEGDEVNGGIIFTRLKYLQLSCLPSLASFCLGKHNFEFPALEKVSVIGCPKMKIFCHGNLITPLKLQTVQFIRSDDEGCWKGNLNTTIQWLFAQKVGYSQLERLKLSNSSELVEIWRRNPQGMLDFKNLQSLEVYDCSTLRFLFTISMALDLAQLHEIKVKKCSVMEHIIVDEGPDEEELKIKIVFPLLSSIILESCGDLASFYQGSKILECSSLKKLDVVDCPRMCAFASKFSTEQRIIETIDDRGNMIKFYRGAVDVFAASFFNNRVALKNLRALKVSRCNGFVNLIASSTAKSLVQLTRMSVTDCDMIEEIIAGEGGEVKDCIAFSQLKYLHLSCLPSLSAFCLRDHVFEFPSLEKLMVMKCPKMKIFCQGDVRTPQLQKVILTEDEEKGRWAGNLKTTIKQLFEEMVELVSKSDAFPFVTHLNQCQC
ncbi:hypothetical protein PTKIN_Ptkin06aG0198100 [Pterospermum kingtungense]